MLPDILKRIRAHGHKKRLEARLRKHDILEHYQENKQIFPDELNMSAIHGLLWELSITIQHRLLTRQDLTESLDHRLLELEHEIQAINEQLHKHGHLVFSCPKGCGDSTELSDEFQHLRCTDCATPLTPDTD